MSEKASGGFSAISVCLSPSVSFSLSQLNMSNLINLVQICKYVSLSHCTNKYIWFIQKILFFPIYLLRVKEVRIIKYKHKLIVTKFLMAGM
jgi:hypothetical protein